MRQTWIFNGFLLAGVLSACGTATPSVAQPVQTQAVTVQIKEVNFAGPVWQGQHITLSGRLYLPGSTAPTQALPAVVMLHGCSGIWSRKDGEIVKDAGGNPVVGSLFTDWGKKLASNGYVALLVDSFTPRGNLDGVCDTDPSITGISEVLDRPQDAYAGYTFLKNNWSDWVNTQKVGLLGWSNGGSATLATLASNTWANPVFKAGVAFYPGCGLYNAFGGITGSTYVPYAPTRIWHGSADDLYLGGNVAYPCTKRLDRAKALQPGIDFDMTVHTGAHHSFDQAKAVGGTFTQADVDARAAADPATLTFLDQKLK